MYSIYNIDNVYPPTPLGVILRLSALPSLSSPTLSSQSPSLISPPRGVFLSLPRGGGRVARAPAGVVQRDAILSKKVSRNGPPKWSQRDASGPQFGSQFGPKRPPDGVLEGVLARDLSREPFRIPK